MPAILSKCQEAPFGKRECAHYVQIVLALIAVSLLSDKRIKERRKQTENNFIFCHLGLCSLGAVNHVIFRALKLMGDINSYLFISTPLRISEDFIPLYKAVRRR